MLKKFFLFPYFFLFPPVQYVVEDKNMCKVVFLSPRSSQFNKGDKMVIQTAIA